MRRLLGITTLGMLAMLSGCDVLPPTEHTACVGTEEEVEVDEDLGGFSIADHARARSGEAEFFAGGDEPLPIEIETTVIGPVVIDRGWDCGDALSYFARAKVVLRGPDFKLVLPATLGTEGFAQPRLEIDDIELSSFDDPFGLEHTYGATDVAVALRFDLEGVDGRGTIEWVLANGRTVVAATIELPWTAE